jgi:hypothetical protein
MQNIEPSFQWESIYIASKDKKSPFFGRHYSQTTYENDIYGYYIHPLWDDIGSETLFCKILFTDYTAKYTIIELFGEWNDTLHNDVMHLKRTVVDHFVDAGIKHFILVGENVLNFHGSFEDDYYAEWFEDVEDGWIAAINFREHVLQEFSRANIDYYLIFGGELDNVRWRTYNPNQLYSKVEDVISHRLA